jgi:hypothetical protein
LWYDLAAADPWLLTRWQEMIGRPTMEGCFNEICCHCGCGNRFALEAVLADIAASAISEVVNLGDHVSGPLEAARTADILMDGAFPPCEATKIGG